MLYFSYGMNTNRSGMAQRCPGALILGHARLIDYSFRFATHADVVKCKGAYVDGVLWAVDEFHTRVWITWKAILSTTIAEPCVWHTKIAL